MDTAVHALAAGQNWMNYLDLGHAEDSTHSGKGIDFSEVVAAGVAANVRLLRPIHNKLLESNSKVYIDPETFFRRHTLSLNARLALSFTVTLTDRHPASTRSVGSLLAHGHEYGPARHTHFGGLHHRLRIDLVLGYYGGLGRRPTPERTTHIANYPHQPHRTIPASSPSHPINRGQPNLTLLPAHSPSPP